MSVMLSACGVWCSGCAAFHAKSKGVAYQARTADAWHRIYDLDVRPEDISCDGCLGPDEDLFNTSRGCKARLCCRGHAFTTCAECPAPSCADLENAQAVWDEVPTLAAALSRSDFVKYAQPYCGHRRRIAAARAAQRARPLASR